MDSSIISALISGAFSLAGILAGVIVSSKLTVYRIDQLEKKVDTLSQVNNAIFELKQHNAVQDEKIETADRRISDLEAYHK
ncbi:MAG: hypothetical protein HDT44_01240 [Ruminococcaceae bacterium]|nr:hypothetical protein [Oscillospiraceae bacterium]